MTAPPPGNRRHAPSAPTPPPEPILSEALMRRIKRNSRRLAVEAMRSMERTLPFVRKLDASQRADVQMVVQTAVANFIDWMHDPDGDVFATVEAFRVVPQDLTRKVRLSETVDMVRVALEFFEQWLPLLARDDAQLVALTESVLRYGRDLGFAAAAVYASAAESRGAWDTRLEAMVVDAIVRGAGTPEMLSQAATLNWRPAAAVTVVIGAPAADYSGRAVDTAHSVAREGGRSLLAVVQGYRLVMVVEGPLDADDPFMARLLGSFGDGPVVIGPPAEGLARAHESAAEALRGYQAAPGWSSAPRPVPASELLPERALIGDRLAVNALDDLVVGPLTRGGHALIETLDAYLDANGSIERCARALYVHPNTVRYRLKKITTATGRDPVDARDAYVLRVAFSVHRMLAAGVKPFTFVTADTLET